MTTRLDIQAAARTLVGTPHKHMGRTPGQFIDCIGVAVCTAKKLKYPYIDATEAYSELPADGLLLKMMRMQELDEVPVAERQIGDIGLFWFDRTTHEPQHLGIFTDEGMVHSWLYVRKCVEHVVDRYWEKRLSHVFRLRGLV